MKNLLITLLILMIPLTCNAITLDEQLKVKQEAEALCTSFNNYCTVKFPLSSIPQGYTTYQGEIILTTELINYLSYDEVRAVALHEVGHRVLKHYEQHDKFLKNWNLDQKKLIAFRHTKEFEADEFATTYFLIMNVPNSLPQALTKLTAPSKMNTTTPTHPSTNSRIERMKYIEYNYYRNLFKQTIGD